MSAVVIPIAERVVTVTMGLHDVHVSRGLGIEGDRRKPSARDAVVRVVQLYVVNVDRVGNSGRLTLPYDSAAGRAMISWSIQIPATSLQTARVAPCYYRQITTHSTYVVADAVSDG